MLNVSANTKIFVYTADADMRKGMQGLSGIVREEFQADPTDGNLFVFINRRRDRMKVLHFDGTGFWLYYRLLESGTFEQLRNPGKSVYLTIDTTELSMLLSGVSLVGASRRRKRYTKQESDQAA